MKKYGKKSVVVMMLFVLLFTSISSVDTYAATKKPGQVKGLKRGKMTCKWDGYRNVSSVKISFKKVKGATGYQVLVYRTNRLNANKTPLVYAYNTKKTTYTIKNLVPNLKYTVKVRAYVKGKNGQIVYGKTKSIKFKMSGYEKGCYFTCNSCGAVVPGNSKLLCKHGDDVYRIHNKEIHAGYTIFWK